MTWHLHVRFQEMELASVYWEQAMAMPQLAPLLESGELRTRQYLTRPVVMFEHNARTALAPLARWTLDFWPSAQISLSLGDHSILVGDGATVYLETAPPEAG